MPIASDEHRVQQQGRSARASWDCLMEAHHYLGFRNPFGTALRHVGKLPGGEWQHWLGWLLRRQFWRLHLIAGNVRRAVYGSSVLPGSEPSAVGSWPVGAAPVVGHGGATAAKATPPWLSPRRATACRARTGGARRTAFPRPPSGRSAAAGAGGHCTRSRSSGTGSSALGACPCRRKQPLGSG